MVNFQNFSTPSRLKCHKIDFLRDDFLAMGGNFTQ